ncbi:MAG: dsRNA-specific ribonuclease, partial [Thermoplasmata archaeon]
MDISELERKIGYVFLDKNLLIRALTTKACALESNQKNPEIDENIEDQEILCTLGDAVLKLILVDKLIKEGSET